MSALGQKRTLIGFGPLAETFWSSTGTMSHSMFRTAGASTAAVHAGSTPHLASALLHHTDPTVTEEHYNRATSLNAAQAYATMVRAIRNCD
jgi:hypothetical protein